MQTYNNKDWIPVNPDDEDSFPKDDNYILVSFENADFVDIGRYEQDEEGGTFYPGDLDKSYVSISMIVNAWQPLPKPYREADEEEQIETNMDRIRKMSAEELAAVLMCPYDVDETSVGETIPCYQNDRQELVTKEECRKCCVNWLKSRVKE